MVLAEKVTLKCKKQRFVARKKVFLNNILIDSSLDKNRLQTFPQELDAGVRYQPLEVLLAEKLMNFSKNPRS
jgi:hypothetical protein